MPKITPALFYTINFWIQTRISNRIYYFSTWPIELNYFRKQRTWIIQIESMGQCDTQRSHLINLTAPFIWCHLAWLVYMELLLCLKNVCFVFFFIFSVVLYSFNVSTFCRDFLPRGSGIVTRRPLILQLINGPAGKLLSIFFRFDPMIFHVFSFFSIETQSLASSCIAREGNSWISMRFEGKLRLKPIE